MAPSIGFYWLDLGRAGCPADSRAVLVRLHLERFIRRCLGRKFLVRISQPMIYSKSCCDCACSKGCQLNAAFSTYAVVIVRLPYDKTGDWERDARPVSIRMNSHLGQLPSLPHACRYASALPATSWCRLAANLVVWTQAKPSRGKHVY